MEKVIGTLAVNSTNLRVVCLLEAETLKKATLPCFPAAGTVCVQKSCHLLASQMLYSLGSISKLQKLELGFHLLFFIRV